MMARGMTLVEVLIAASTFVVVSLAAVTLLAMGLQANETAQVIGDLQRDALACEAKILRDLHEASFRLVTNRTEGTPPFLAVPTARNAQGRVVTRADGSADWQAWVVYSLQGGALHRERIEVRPVNPGFDPTSHWKGGGVIGRNVAGFHARSRTGSGGFVGLAVTLSFRRYHSSRLNEVTITEMAFCGSDG